MGQRLVNSGQLNFYKVIVVRVLVQKCFQYLRSIIVRIFYFLISEKGDSFFLPGFLCSYFLPFHGQADIYDPIYLSSAGSFTPLRRNASALSIQVPHTPQGFSPPS